MSIIFIISLQTNKILWVKSPGCYVNHGTGDIASLRMNDTLFITGFCNGLIMAIDSSLNAKWIVRPDTLDSIYFGLFPDVKGMVKLNDSLIAISTNEAILGIFNIKTKSMVGLTDYYSSSSHILKIDLNGTTLWGKIISLQEYYLQNFNVKDILFDGENREFNMD